MNIVLKFYLILASILVFASIFGVSESSAQESELIASPKYQLESGIAPENIQCREDRVLVLRPNGNPACVKETTPEKLGWKIVETDSSIIEVKSKENSISSDSTVEYGEIIDANNKFAFEFYSEIKDDNENIFYSPWSISTAFAIAYEGAKEKTEQEIQQVFGFPVDYDTRTAEFQTAINDLNPEDVPYQLSVANALWLAERFEPFQEYVDTATVYYDSEVNTVDFVSNDGVEKINAWVEDKTNEKIKNILAPGSTDEYTRLAITNAIYFKGNWVTQFNETDTSDDPFWITPSENVPVPMMRLVSEIFNYTQTETTQILKMPYEGDKLSMTVLLPNEKSSLSELEESLSVENLKQWNEQLSPNEVHVFMPKFKMETEYFLIGPLSDMGMPTPFVEGDANFQGIAPIPLFISQAVHKAFVDVNEEGTEAAAATALVMTTTSVKPPVPVFKADHPFVFLIQDDSTENILFIGRVMNPTN
jgi:serpin B